MIYIEKIFMAVMILNVILLVYIALLIVTLEDIEVVLVGAF